MAYGLVNSLDLERGSSQYASIADASQTGLDVTGALTVEGWIKVESTPGAGVYYTIACKGGISVAISDTTLQYDLFYRNDGDIALQFFVRGSGVNAVANYTFTFTTGTWYHVAGTYEPSTAVRLVVNGSEVGTPDTSSVPASLVNTARPFGVGADQASSAANYFDGRVSLVRVWDVLRSPATISANMCNVYGTATANMQGEWSFDNVYTDASGNGNTLTASGAPGFGADVPSTCSTPSTTIKTYNGATTATVKSVLNGTVIANRKTWNSIT